MAYSAVWVLVFLGVAHCVMGGCTWSVKSTIMGGTSSANEIVLCPPVGQPSMTVVRSGACRAADSSVHVQETSPWVGMPFAAYTGQTTYTNYADKAVKGWVCTYGTASSATTSYAWLYSSVECCQPSYTVYP